MKKFYKVFKQYKGQKDLTKVYDFAGNEYTLEEGSTVEKSSKKKIRQHGNAVNYVSDCKCKYGTNNDYGYNHIIEKFIKEDENAVVFEIEPIGRIFKGYTDAPSYMTVISDNFYYSSKVKIVKRIK